MAKKYKVVYDRKDCIGAAACTAVSKMWVIKDGGDGKADLENSESKQNNDVQERIIGEIQLEEMMETARVCPVNIIHIYDLETGEKIIW